MKYSTNRGKNNIIRVYFFVNGGRKCLNRSTNHANARILVVGTAIAGPVRSITAKTVQEQIAGKTGRKKVRN
jgi:hypothetical protein